MDALPPIDLDAAATTRIAPSSRAVLVAALDEGWGNPSSRHARGSRARAGIDEVICKASMERGPLREGQRLRS